MEEAKKRIYRLMTGLEGSRIIYQYMDLDYLIRLLDKEEYCVNPKKFFVDPNERELSQKDLFSTRKVRPLFKLSGENSDELNFNLSDEIRKTNNILTSCWTYQPESYLMWVSSPTKLRACIKSTIDNFVASFKHDDHQITVGYMSYNGYSIKQEWGEAMFSKSMIYEGEKEIRFYFDFFDYLDDADKAGNKVGGMARMSVDPKVMIDDIILSPLIEHDAAEWFVNMIKAKFKVPVRVSNTRIR